MARADAHTRVVTWLKIALPLAALAILSTLFLLADKIDPEDALPYAEVDVEDLAREPRMTLPSNAGTTSDGAALIVLSGGVTLTTSQGYVLETPEIRASLDRSGLEAPSAVTATTPSGKLTSNSMTLSQDNQTPNTYLMVFKGDVRLVYLPGG